MTNTLTQNSENTLPSCIVPEIAWDEKTLYETRIQQNGIQNRFASPMVSNLFSVMTSKKALSADAYLDVIQDNVSSDLIASRNFAEIKKLASFFTRDVTSFFGFETRLHSKAASSDFLFAVSSCGGEREALAALLTNGFLPEQVMKQSAWQRLADFAGKWADPASDLYKQVLGLWLEFDTADGLPEIPIPSVFIHMKPFRFNSSEDVKKVSWLTKSAIPMLFQGNMSMELEQQLVSCVEKLPGNALLFDVGIMLSRSVQGLRLVIIRLQPDEIISYLESLGWEDTDNGLATLIAEVEQYSNRIILHINISENGVDPKIGLECSYAPDLYHQEQNWSGFFKYLIAKGICLPEKQEILLDFMGVTHDNPGQTVCFDQYSPLVKISENISEYAVIRYLSHIKIVYKYGNNIEAKAYPGVRLFGRTEKDTRQYQ